MSNVVKMSMFRESRKPTNPKDPWCAQLTLSDGRKIAGGAARERRLAAVGGVEKLLGDFLASATALASRKAS